MAQKNFVVIGGSRGIGLGIVRRLQERGDNVTVVSRTAGSLSEIPGVTHVQADVTKDTLDASQLPETIDGMAYCPGSINLGPLRGVSEETLIDDFRINVVGAVKCIQAALKPLKNGDRSSLVLFSTVAVSQGLAMHTSVAAAKGAVEGVVRTLAAELAPKVRVNCVAPSLTDTPLAENLLSSDAKRKAMSERHPLKRVGTIDDIAAMATFLLSEESDWVTGQLFGVDGGMSRVRA